MTAPCAAGAPGTGVSNDPNAIATSVIAAPTGGAPNVTTSTAVTTARKFVTPAAEIQPGLTSLPVAVASALGADPNAGPQPPATSAAGTNATASPGNFANGAASESGAFAGATFTTNGVVTAGISSIAVASQIPASAR